MKAEFAAVVAFSCEVDVYRQSTKLQKNKKTYYIHIYNNNLRL